MTYLFRLILLSLFFFLLSGCTKKEEPRIQWENVYSTIEEFSMALDSIQIISEELNIIAYPDTLENGYPDTTGENYPLANFIDEIKVKIENDSLESAVYDVFHFDGTPNSLISFLMKANLIQKISAQQMVNAVGLLPVPPVAVANFVPPQNGAPLNPPPPAHGCFAKMKIRATWAYYPRCGNRRDTMDVYAANNTLTNRETGTLYRFTSETEHCGCGGTTTCTLDAPRGASYGFSNHGGWATLFSESAGTYKITFTYTCSCGCGTVVTEVFTINFR